MRCLVDRQIVQKVPKGSTVRLGTAVGLAGQHVGVRVVCATGWCPFCWGVHACVFSFLCH